MHVHQKAADQLNHYVSKIFSEISSGLNSPGDEITTLTHTLRKGLKRVRALVKLIRHKQPVNSYESANKLLRDWGRIFSDLRDAHVRTQVINQLKEVSDFQSLHSELNQLNELNLKEIEAIENSLLNQNNKFSWLNEEIEKNESIEKYFSIDDLNVNDLNEGLKNSYNKSFDIFCIVKEHRVPEDLHEWRKRLKDFQYQLEFTDQIRGNNPDKRTELSAEINDHLGVDQDYFNLMIWLMYQKEKFSRPEHYSRFMEQVKEMRSALQKEAFNKATLLYDM